MRGSAGSAAAPAARWRNLRRGSFIVPPVACSAESLLTLLPLHRLVDDLVSRASERDPDPGAHGTSHFLAPGSRLSLARGITSQRLKRGARSAGTRDPAQNSDPCRSSAFAFFLRSADVPASASAVGGCSAGAGSISSGPSLSARLTAGETA